MSGSMKRTCADVQGRLFDPFFITKLFSGYKGRVLVAEK